MKLKTILTSLAMGALLATSAVSMADETVKEKAHEAAHDTKRAAKKTARKVKDKTCEMVNGKMECAGKKIKHSAQNAGDKIEDAVD